MTGASRQRWRDSWLSGLVAIGAIAAAASVVDAQLIPPGEIHERNLRKATLILETGGHTHVIREMFFTPDGTRLISVDEREEIRSWDVAAGKSVRRIHSPDPPDHQGIVRAAALSPDGRLLAVSGEKTRWKGDNLYVHLVRLYDLEAGEALGFLEALRSGPLRDLAFSPDGRYLAAPTATETGTVVLWEVADWRRHLLTGAGSRLTTVAFSPDGQRLVSGTLGGGLHIWDIRAGRPLVYLKGHDYEITALAWSPDGRWIASASEDRTVRLWDPDSRIAVGRFDTRGSVARGVGDWLASASWLRGSGHRPRSWSERLSGWPSAIWGSGVRLVNGSLTAMLERSGHVASSLSFSPDSRKLLVGADGRSPVGVCTVIEVPSGKAIARFSRLAYGGHATAFSPDGQLVATGGGPNHEIHLWRPETSELVQEMVGAGRAVWAVGVSHDGRSVALGQTFRFLGGTNYGPLEYSLPLDRLDLRPDLQPARWGEFGREVREWGPFDLEGSLAQSFWLHKGDEATYELRHDRTTTATFFADGRGIVRGTLAGGLSRYTREDSGWFETHSFSSGAMRRSEVPVWSAAPSPTHNWFVVTGSADQTLTFWRYQEAVILFVGADGGWVAWTTLGNRYAASPGGERYIRWRVERGENRVPTIYPASRFRKWMYAPWEVQRELLR